MNLENRRIYEDGHMDPDLSAIDYEQAEISINRLKDFSLDWLKTALVKSKSEIHLAPYYGTKSYTEKEKLTYSICPKNACTGCSACYNACEFNAIEMIADDEGFLYPVKNEEKCAHCYKCINACPVLKPLDPKIRENIEPRGVYAAYSLDEDIRFWSTSGGAFWNLPSIFFHWMGFVLGRLTMRI